MTIDPRRGGGGLTRAGLWEDSTWEWPVSRRGRGGVEWGGDPWVALVGERSLTGSGDDHPLHLPVQSGGGAVWGGDACIALGGGSLLASGI